MVAGLRNGYSIEDIADEIRMAITSHIGEVCIMASDKPGVTWEDDPCCYDEHLSDIIKDAIDFDTLVEIAIGLSPYREDKIREMVSGLSEDEKWEVYKIAVGKLRDKLKHYSRECAEMIREWEEDG